MKTTHGEFFVYNGNYLPHLPVGKVDKGKEKLSTTSVVLGTVTRRYRNPMQEPTVPPRPKTRISIEISATVRSFTTVDHLNPEAVAALVDNELSPAAAHRARIHLVHCTECRGEVEKQRRASQRLKEASCCEEVKVSHELLSRLHQIAQSCSTDGPCADDIFPNRTDSLMGKLRSLKWH